ncbi:MAG: tRNA adenosine(34) deaminase TadA [Calditrichaeota bacterium]|nr:tRNA adenosine(34) deaminase TadA [Calditrichota bacterium]
MTDFFEPFSFDKFMKYAIDEAVKAYEKKEVPVGAIVVYENKVIGRGHNMTLSLNDPTAHAEIIAITAACSYLESDRLRDCQLYVTVEPCIMCAGAIINSRINQLIFGAYQPKYGAFGSILNVNQTKINHTVQVIDGIMESDCEALLKLFFQEKRKKNN